MKIKQTIILNTQKEGIPLAAASPTWRVKINIIFREGILQNYPHSRNLMKKSRIIMLKHQIIVLFPTKLELVRPIHLKKLWTHIHVNQLNSTATKIHYWTCPAIKTKLPAVCIEFSLNICMVLKVMSLTAQYVIYRTHRPNVWIC